MFKWKYTKRIEVLKFYLMDVCLFKVSKSFTLDVGVV